MRIGIITLPLHTNIGGILQTYALQNVLKELGHEVVTLDPPHYYKLPLWKKPLSYTKRIIQKYILGIKGIEIFSESKNNKTFAIITQNTQKFIKTNINVIEVRNLKKIKKEKFDVIIVGSDQIWRPTYYKKIETAYLDFTKGWNIKRIGYAISFGTDIWEYNKKQTENCKQLIQTFQKVSIREDSGVKLCQQYLNYRAEHVLDPTLLLDKKIYTDITKNHYPICQGELLYYILDNNSQKDELITIISKHFHYKPFSVNAKTEDENSPINERIQIPVEEWLYGFQNAKFIITDSFHACVFAIIFNKQFVVYGNKERGMARFHSLLSLFNLTDRLITNYEDFLKLDIINYKTVNKILNTEKQKSLSFLKTALQNEHT